MRTTDSGRQLVERAGEHDVMHERLRTLLQQPRGLACVIGDDHASGDRGGESVPPDDGQRRRVDHAHVAGGVLQPDRSTAGGRIV